MSDQQFIKALDARSEVELTVTGRTSGRDISLPVWFVREGDTLYLVPVNGSDSDWYKNAQRRPTIRLSQANVELSARATPVTDPATVAQILDKVRAKYGSDDV